MRPLVNVPASSERVMYVFYDFETTHNTKLSDRTNEHVPNPVCLQQFCSKCENISDIEQDCIQCCKRIHSFWDITNYGIDEMIASERNEFLAWYKGQKGEVFDNRRVLEAYCQDDVSVLREACRVLRREFIQWVLHTLIQTVG